MSILSIKNLSFTYASDANFKAVLKNISLTAYEGDFILLCGASGSGKTSLLKMIKSSLTPAGNMEGEISLSVPDEKIGYVFQQPDSQPVMEKVFDELIFGCENLGLDTSQINQRLSEITAFFGIEALTDMDLASLSGGQKQLINLASVMMMQPDIIIFDEPLSQLDAIASVSFVNIIKRLHDELGMTIIICEHELSDILPCASKVWFMNDGSVSEFGSSDSFINYIVKEKKEHMLPPLIKAAVSYDAFGDSYPYSVADFKKLNIPNDFLESYISDSRRNKPSKHENDLRCICGRGLYFRYGKNERDVLKGLDINIPYNSFYAIIGGNGSGKSTLLSLMTGYRQAYKGKFTEALGRKHADSISYLPQNPLYLFTEETLYDDYEKIIQRFNIPKSSLSTLLESNPLFMPISSLLSHNASEISGGELQTAAILLLHLLDRNVLLLDEPTKAMDSACKNRLSAYLKGLIECGKTIIMVSHDLEFVSENATHCGLMFDGRIVSENECHALLKNNSFYTAALFRCMRKD